MPLRTEDWLFLLAIVFALPTSLPGKWTKSQYDHVTIVSNASESDVEIKAEALWEARLGLNILFPSIAQFETEPLLFVYAGNKKVRDELTYGTGLDRDTIIGFYTQDADGHIAVITDEATFVDGRQVLVHEYVHFLTERHKSAPMWLSEGIAGLFSTIHQNSKGKLVIGEAVSINVLEMQLVKMLPSEALLNMEHDDKEKHSGLLYSQSWLFLHYLMFGEHEIPSSGIQNFIENAFLSPTTSEESLIHHLGLSYTQLDERLEKYIKRGTFGLYSIDLDAEHSFQVQAYEPLPKIERDELFCRIKLLTKSTIVSENWIQDAYKRWPNNPEINVSYGYTLLNKRDFESALRSFEKAFDQGLRTPRLHIGFAIAQLNVKTENGAKKLSEQDTITCLHHLFEARSLGGTRSADLYRYVADIWNASEVPPEDKHMSIIWEGLQRHPDEWELAIDLASYYQRSNRPDIASSIVQRTLPYLTTRRREILLELFPLPDKETPLTNP